MGLMLLKVLALMPILHLTRTHHDSFIAFTIYEDW